MSSETNPAASIDGASFRKLCSRFATGIAVVTVCEAGGKRHGMTVNSFTSVSLDPPLVLVCVDLKTRILDYLTEGAPCAISILSEDQKDISARFAGPAEDRFEGIGCHIGAGGAPVIDGALAEIECVVERLLEAGDHVIVLGRVVAGAARDGRPLLYYSSAYARLG